MNVKFIVLGCKSNLYDANQMKSMFVFSGHRIVDDTAYDCAVLVSCCVTNESERKSRQMLRRLKHESPGALLVAAGCYAQIAGQRLLDEGLCDVCVGTAHLHEIVQICEKALAQKQPLLCSSALSHAQFHPFSSPVYHDKTRATIKIQDGCNQFCSYCIIPYTRGPVRSRAFSEIVAQAQKTVEAGFCEIVLTGIHLASYHDRGKRLIDVIEALSNIKGLQRIRVGSLEPHVLSDAFLQRAAALPVFCPHFHVSIQSGSDAVLKAMNRHYTSAFVLDRIAAIRRCFPEAILTTDIIVGFPTETEEDFRQTLSFLSGATLYHVHAFPYSPKKGTPAAKMPQTTTKRQKHERLQTLCRMQDAIQERIHASYVGKQVCVLTETTDSAGNTHGYTKNYIRVNIQALLPPNKLLNCVVTGYNHQGLFAQPLS